MLNLENAPNEIIIEGRIEAAVVSKGIAPYVACGVSQTPNIQLLIEGKNDENNAIILNFFLYFRPGL